MLMLSQEQTAHALHFDKLVDALERMFRADCETPVRHQHSMKVPGEADATLLLMPAWVSGRYGGVKVVNVVPGNATRGLPAVAAEFLLFDARTGQMLALVDGGELTARRTAAASALAARFLARKDARHLVIAGTGRLSVNLAMAHASERSLEKISVWGRSPEKAVAVAAKIKLALGIEAEPVTDLEAAVSTADIVSTATLATEPLIHGDWLPEGCHLDLIGGFRPDMREADDEAIRRASVYVDTRAGCPGEAGDISQPLASGALEPEGIKGDLFDLVRGTCKGRTGEGEITLFKSVGAALEDLAGAVLAYETAKN